jgi:hemolysin activation/secretion protein
MLNSSFFKAFAISLFGLSLSVALAEEVPHPQTGGEWVQANLPVVEALGEAGVQPYQERVDIKIPDHLVLIGSDILEKLATDQPFAYDQVRVRVEGEPSPDNATLQALDFSSFQKKPLLLEEYNQLAKAVSEQKPFKQHLYQMRLVREFTPGETPFSTLWITLKPVKIGQVEVEGNRFFGRTVLKRQLGLKPGQTLSLGSLERKVRLLQDNPSITAGVELESVDLSDTVNVRLKVKDDLPVHISGFWNNLDHTFYGDQFVGVSTVLSNTTGNDDTSMATVVTDPRVHGVFTHYEIPLNTHGTRFAVDYSYLRANPVGKDFNPYHLKGRMWNVTTTLNQVLIAREHLRLSTDLNVDVREIRTISSLGSLDGESWKNATIERDRLRDLRIGIQLKQAGEHHELSMRNEVSVGLPIFGATPNSNKNLGNPGGGSQFFKYVGLFSYSHELPWNTEAVLNGTFQWVPGTPSSVDVGALGGAYLGRGYPEGSIPADNVIFGSAEFRCPFFLAPSRWHVPGTDERLRDKARLVSFVDYGYGKVNDKDSVPKPINQILSTGVGVRVEFSKYLSGRLDFGIPLIKVNEPINKYGPRIHFGLQANLL